MILFASDVLVGGVLYLALVSRQNTVQEREQAGACWIISQFLRVQVWSYYALFFSRDSLRATEGAFAVSGAMLGSFIVMVVVSGVDGGRIDLENWAGVIFREILLGGGIQAAYLVSFRSAEVSIFPTISVIHHTRTVSSFKDARRMAKCSLAVIFIRTIAALVARYKGGWFHGFYVGLTSFSVLLFDAWILILSLVWQRRWSSVRGKTVQSSAWFFDDWGRNWEGSGNPLIDPLISPNDRLKRFMDIMEDLLINFDEVILEHKPMASGGGGQVYKGWLYKDKEIVAKVRQQKNDKIETF